MVVLSIQLSPYKGIFHFEPPPRGGSSTYNFFLIFKLLINLTLRAVKVLDENIIFIYKMSTEYNL
jgi:hypothetical protein